MPKHNFTAAKLLKKMHIYVEKLTQKIHISKKCLYICKKSSIFAVANDNYEHFIRNTSSYRG